MKMFETTGLIGHPLGLEATRSGVGDGDRDAGFRRPEAPPGQIERVPTETQSVARYGRQHRQSRRQHDPAGRGRKAKQAPHGNTLRSSSKCGPSRSVGQSPPHTMVVP